MSPRVLILVLAALVATGSTVYFAYSWLSAERAALEAMKTKPEEPAALAVLVAKQPLAAGMFVRQEDLRWQPWPDEAVPENYLIKGDAKVADIVGAVVRRGIEAGEPITQNQIVAPGDRGFMAAVLNPGMRAISVPVNKTTGVSGFVFPGDTVDLILTMNFTEEGKDRRSKRFGSETFLTGVRILAIDQRTTDLENKPKVADTVTLEVTPEQVEMITVAMELGRMSLALHSLARPDQPAAEELVAGEQIEVVSAGQREPASANEANGADRAGGADAAPASDGGDRMAAASDPSGIAVAAGRPDGAPIIKESGVEPPPSAADGLAEASAPDGATSADDSRGGVVVANESDRPPMADEAGKPMAMNRTDGDESRAEAGDGFDIPLPGGTFTIDSDASRLRRATIDVPVQNGPRIVEMRGGSRKGRSAN